MKKLVLIFALLVMVFTGCSGKSAKNEDRTDMDFTVVPREDSFGYSTRRLLV